MPTQTAIRDEVTQRIFKADLFQVAAMGPERL